ncbi:MAG: hypothetical protein HQM16_10530 [Deltaproteobacteria bacterium]|nr:hypothetical protein [Deltaproteobacteria bacterium]
MKITNKTLQKTLALIACMGLIHCGVSDAISTSVAQPGSGSVTEAEAEDIALSVVATTGSLAAITSSLTGAGGQNLKELADTYGPEQCAVSGTETYSYDVTSTAMEINLTYDTCDHGYGAVFDGGIALDGSFTDNDLSATITFTNYTTTMDSETLTVSGSVGMALEQADHLVTITYNLAIGINDASVNVTGSLSIDEDAVANGTMTAADASHTYTCTFTDFNMNDASEEDFQNACSGS